MENTFTLHSTTTDKNYNKRSTKLKAETYEVFRSYIPMMVYAVFLMVSLMIALFSSLLFSSIFFIVGSIVLAALYVWVNTKGADMEVSFQIDVDQSELERELYEQVA